MGSVEEFEEGWETIESLSDRVQEYVVAFRSKEITIDELILRTQPLVELYNEIKGGGTTVPSSQSGTIPIDQAILSFLRD